MNCRSNSHPIQPNILLHTASGQRRRYRHHHRSAWPLVFKDRFRFLMTVHRIYPMTMTANWKSLRHRAACVYCPLITRTRNSQSMTIIPIALIRRCFVMRASLLPGSFFSDKLKQRQIPVVKKSVMPIWSNQSRLIIDKFNSIVIMYFDVGIFFNRIFLS